MKLLREPLFHFLVLGALVFGVHSLVSKSSSNKPGEIVITRGKIENLVVGFTGTWQRPPNDEELQGLIRDYVREEVAYREALAMGLDRDDSIVRGRLRQKLEFVSDSVAARVEPTDADLQAYLQAHASDFQSETTLSFEQVYLDPQRHGAQLGQDAARHLRDLRQAGENADLSIAGDPFVLQSRFENLPFGEIKKMFGDQFATELSVLKTGQWQGPIESGFGAHLVLVRSRIDGRLPPLADVRQEVRREWANARRREATDKFYQALLQHYTVRIEPLPEKKLAEVR
jgi:hypothetical protein